METMYIDEDDVNHVLNAITRLWPNNKNRSTKYTDPRYSCHCLAGQILSGLGVPVPGANDDCNEAPFTSTPTQAFYASAGVEFSLGAEQTIQRIQNEADYGVKYNEQPTWANAIRTAA